MTDIEIIADLLALGEPEIWFQRLEVVKFGILSLRAAYDRWQQMNAWAATLCDPENPRYWEMNRLHGIS